MDGPSLDFCRRCNSLFAPGRRAGGTYCSTSCASKAKWEAKYGPLPKCLNCDSELESRKKRYCNSSCQQAFFLQKNINDWLEGKASGGDINGELKPMYRRYLVNVAGNECTECGWSEVNPTSGQVTLTVDHVDGDARNNSIDNLKVLCYNCHTLTPTFNHLNRGKGTRKFAPGTRRSKAD